MIIHEAYVVPSITDEDKLRQSVIRDSSKNHNYGILHYHKFKHDCYSAVKPCECYQDGKLVNNLIEGILSG